MSKPVRDEGRQVDKAFRFMDLPTEIRLKVYGNLITARGNFLPRSQRPLHFQILSTSRLVNGEAAPVLYSRIGLDLDLADPDTEHPTIAVSPPLRGFPGTRFTKHLCFKVPSLNYNDLWEDFFWGLRSIRGALPPPYGVPVVSQHNRVQHGRECLQAAFPNVVSVTMDSSRQRSLDRAWVLELLEFVADTFGNMASLGDISVVERTEISHNIAPSTDWCDISRHGGHLQTEWQTSSVDRIPPSKNPYVAPAIVHEPQTIIAIVERQHQPQRQL